MTSVAEAAYDDLMLLPTEALSVLDAEKAAVALSSIRQGEQ